MGGAPRGCCRGAAGTKLHGQLRIVQPIRLSCEEGVLLNGRLVLGHGVTGAPRARDVAALVEEEEDKEVEEGKARGEERGEEQEAKAGASSSAAGGSSTRDAESEMGVVAGLSMVHYNEESILVEGGAWRLSD